MSLQLADVPAAYTLQYFDDCGVPGRQPHVVATNATHTFAPGSVDAPERDRSVTYGVPHFDMAFDGLAPGVSYVLAVTYASERGNRRVQRLRAGEWEIHGPRALPDGIAERLVFRVPDEAVEDGRLALHFLCDEGHNAVASRVELWAPLPTGTALHLEAHPRITGRVFGKASDLSYQGIPNAVVTLRTLGGQVRTTHTDSAGAFDVDVSDFVGTATDIEVTATWKGVEAQANVPVEDLRFEAPGFRPMPNRLAGVKNGRILLDGTWKIHAEPEEKFYEQEADGDGGRPFTVPGQWLQQGIDVSRDQAVGIATRFEVPRSWRGRRIILRFEAVHGAADYWLNGVLLGHSERLFTPIEFDVTDVVQCGAANRLALRMVVDSPSELLSFSSNYAFHNLGGIDRSVYLFALPPVHLSRFHIDTRLDDAYRDGMLQLAFAIANTMGTLAADLELRVRLDGADVHASWRLPIDSAPPGETTLLKAFPVADPAKWSAEKPNLYRLVAELCAGGDVVERIERAVGFRSVEVDGSRLLVNGQGVKLAGVNRHEIDPLTGRAATARHAEQDALLLRDANFNFIRTSHYPPTKQFLDACDRLGLYVECEAPFCWTRGGRGEDDPALAKRFLDPTAAMIDFHRDHPSVILWSVGNESGSGPDGPNRLPENFAAAVDLCRRLDATRPVIFNNEWSRDGGACDIAVIHYPPFPPEEYEFVKDDRRPILIDEYFPPQTFTFADELRINPGLDVVNWSSGQNSPNSFCSQLFSSPRTLGGSIWAGIDEEFIFSDGQVKGYGPWGFVDVWRRPKSLWWDAKCIHSPIWIPVRSVEYCAGQDEVRIPVENRYSFTSTGELRIVWEAGAHSGRCRADVPPLSTGEIAVRVPKDVAEGELLVLRVEHTDGREIMAHGIRLGRAPAVALPSPAAGCPEYRDNGATIAIHANDFALVIDKATGNIRSMDGTASVAITSFPTLFISRTETKNVFSPGGMPYAQYPDAATRVVDRVSAEARGQAVAITVEDRYDEFTGYVEMLVDKAGQATVSFDYAYGGDSFAVSEWGVRFAMAEECQSIAWRRASEWDVYPEDHIGRPEGHASAQMPKKWRDAGSPPYLSPPEWPWHLDANELGTRDFRATKYTVYEACLEAPGGAGIRIDSDASHNVRACLASGAVHLHVLESRHPAELNSTTHVMGSCRIRLIPSPEGSR
ncbi:MAG TPA: glycoside hydrolase family 2 TIM barrel-domain containing protein [Candidatus Hydrogenedentes bacterium]|nr:glycoside hydrolase family 2 TIM barrel-domain containing protein [Candidatus Hydrogenedentota bacterium]HPG67843.1 glycoside hydrolase family 2 TIM barrel-domain containing protein [Candidatus Hydrogenedentota bacterium]